MEKNITFICDIRMQKFTTRILNEGLTSIRLTQFFQTQRIRRISNSQMISNWTSKEFSSIRETYSRSLPNLNWSQWQLSRTNYEPNWIPFIRDSARSTFRNVFSIERTMENNLFAEAYAKEVQQCLSALPDYEFYKPLVCSSKFQNNFVERFSEGAE